MYINIRKRTSSKNNCHNCHTVTNFYYYSFKKLIFNEIRYF